QFLERHGLIGFIFEKKCAAAAAVVSDHSFKHHRCAVFGMLNFGHERVRVYPLASNQRSMRPATDRRQKRYLIPCMQCGVRIGVVYRERALVRMLWLNRIRQDYRVESTEINRSKTSLDSKRPLEVRRTASFSRVSNPAAIRSAMPSA